MLGVAGDDVAEVDVGWQLLADELDGGRQQELGGGVVQFAQHTAELAAGGQGALDVEAVGRGRIGPSGKPRSQTRAGCSTR